MSVIYHSSVFSFSETSPKIIEYLNNECVFSEKRGHATAAFG